MILSQVGPSALRSLVAILIGIVLAAPAIANPTCHPSAPVLAVAMADSPLLLTDFAGIQRAFDSAELLYAALADLLRGDRDGRLVLSYEGRQIAIVKTGENLLFDSGSGPQERDGDKLPESLGRGPERSKNRDLSQQLESDSQSLVAVEARPRRSTTPTARGPDSVLPKNDSVLPIGRERARIRELSTGCQRLNGPVHTSLALLEY